jgi:hypothetical protein
LCWHDGRPSTSYDYVDLQPHKFRCNFRKPVILALCEAPKVQALWCTCDIF